VRRGKEGKQEMYERHNTDLMENLNKPGNYNDVTHNSVISGFLCAVNEVWVLLDVYAAYIDSLLPTIWGVVPKRR